MRGRANVIPFATLAAMLLAACSAPPAKDAPSTGAAAAAPAQPNVAEIRALIDAANQRVIPALIAGDVAGATANYADSVVVMMTGMPMMKGKTAVEAGFKGMLEVMKLDAFSSATLDVQVSGDMAVETGTFAMTSTMKGAKPVKDVGKYLTVWQRQADGGWKVIRDINNSDIAPAAAK